MNDNQIINMIANLYNQEQGMYDACTELVNRYGFFKLGNGASAYAFEHPADKSKIVRISGNAFNDGWLSFILYTREHPCAAFPVVYAQRVVSPKLVITVMERLHEDIERGDRVIDALGGRSYCNKNRMLWTKHFDTESCVLIDKMTDDLGYWDDLWYANVMFRSNGQAVLTDPYHLADIPNKYKIKSGQISAETNLEVITHAERLETDAVMVGLCEDVTVRHEAQNQMLRGQPEPIGKPRWEGIQSPLLPGKLGLRWIHQTRVDDVVRVEITRRRQEQWAALARFQQRFVQPMVDKYVQQAADRMFLPARVYGLDLPKPIRPVGFDGAKVWAAARPEGLQARNTRKGKRDWGAGVPCQKAIAAERRRRAEVHSKLSRKAA